jgi:hypothetical protein
MSIENTGAIERQTLSFRLGRKHRPDPLRQRSAWPDISRRELRRLVAAMVD